jgi:hypothetical protein
MFKWYTTPIREIERTSHQDGKSNIIQRWWNQKMKHEIKSSLGGNHLFGLKERKKMNKGDFKSNNDPKPPLYNK